MSVRSGAFVGGCVVGLLVFVAGCGESVDVAASSAATNHAGGTGGSGGVSRSGDSASGITGSGGDAACVSAVKTIAALDGQRQPSTLAGVRSLISELSRTMRSDASRESDHDAKVDMLTLANDMDTGLRDVDMNKEPNVDSWETDAAQVKTACDGS